MPDPFRKDVRSRPVNASASRQLSTKELVLEVTRKGSLLARKEVELAKSELRADLKAELTMARGLGIAGVCGVLTVAMLLVALVLGLAQAGFWSEWLGALVVAAVALAVGTAVGLFGWARRVRTPMEATRRTLRDDVRFAKETVA